MWLKIPLIFDVFNINNAGSNSVFCCSLSLLISWSVSNCHHHHLSLYHASSSPGDVAWIRKDTQSFNWKCLSDTFNSCTKQRKHTVAMTYAWKVLILTVYLMTKSATLENLISLVEMYSYNSHWINFFPQQFFFFSGGIFHLVMSTRWKSYKLLLLWANEWSERLVAIRTNFVSVFP